MIQTSAQGMMVDRFIKVLEDTATPNYGKEHQNPAHQICSKAALNSPKPSFGVMTTTPDTFEWLFFNGRLPASGLLYSISSAPARCYPSSPLIKAPARIGEKTVSALCWSESLWKTGDQTYEHALTLEIVWWQQRKQPLVFHLWKNGGGRIKNVEKIQWIHEALLSQINIMSGKMEKLGFSKRK